MRSVLSAFGLKVETAKLELLGTGLINRTWKVTTPGEQYILQRVNNKVFQKPGNIAHNVKLVAAYLKQRHPDYCFIAPVAANDGSEMIYLENEGFFRLFPFVEGSHTIDVVETPEMAYEAAKQFGQFTRLLAGFNVSELKVTIPDFHNLPLRYRQFQEAQKGPVRERWEASKDLVQELTAHAEIVHHFSRIICNPQFKVRVTHHDTKISNVLFDKDNKGLCVIDLDTMMPGHFISDVGDMMRTYLSPVGEEEQDVERIEVRDEFYQAIVGGYLDQMKDELTSKEKDHFFFAGSCMIYMQALRFLTDYLNNDRYYGARYEQHNLVRARNQAMLLKRFLEKESVLTNCDIL
jgi:Ser/Thr protein kinase RdoA (MazF antagonist)